MVFITGDCHGEWNKFSTESFPEQKEMSRDDFVIVCGDFGLWHKTKTEEWWFRWLSAKSFTILFVDGNHENFDRLYGNEFEVVDFHGGKAHKITENVYHLMRGYVFDLCGKKFFAFGGAASHDITDGIVEPDDYGTTKELTAECNRRTMNGEMFRVNHFSWWKQEMPSDEEMKFGIQTMMKNNNNVDFVITHCCPQKVAAIFSFGEYKEDPLTKYFDTISDIVSFKKWFFGHYHIDYQVNEKFIALYDQIIRVL